MKGKRPRLINVVWSKMLKCVHCIDKGSSRTMFFFKKKRKKVGVNQWKSDSTADGVIIPVTGSPPVPTIGGYASVYHAVRDNESDQPGHCVKDKT